MNIANYLAAGYESVILCCPDKKSLGETQSSNSPRLEEIHRDKVLFMEPEEIIFFLEKEAARSSQKEERIKGYKVKVQY